MNPGVSHASACDVIEQRLAAAAQAIRARDLCAQQHRQLSAREETAAAEAAAARNEFAGAEKDVERLGHLSLARVLAALRGHGRGAGTAACGVVAGLGWAGTWTRGK